MTRSTPGPLSVTTSQSLLKPMSIESVMPSNRLILCRPLLLLPSIFPSIRVFANESALHIRWPKYWSFSFSISPSNEHPGLISFRMDWLDLLAVQGTLKRLLQQHSSEASLLRCWAFPMDAGLCFCPSELCKELRALSLHTDPSLSHCCVPACSRSQGFYSGLGELAGAPGSTE